MRIFVALVSLLSAATILGAGSFLLLPNSDSTEEVIFEVIPGSSFKAVANDLEEKQLVRSALELRIVARLNGSESKVRTGEYAIPRNWRPLEILDLLKSGKSIEYSFTVPEGKNIYEMAEIIAAKGYGTASEFINLCKDRKLIRDLLGEDLPSLEGYLFPETYKITKYTQLKDIVKAMVKNFLTNYEQAIKGSQLSMPRHELVTLASVIEKETGAPEERPMISSVFHNRLRKKMRLQSDPTILYGMLVKSGKLQNNIRKADILRPTPYNTYTVKALPVGPIANPGLEAMRAALNPVESNFFYFVSRNNGTHVFTETYAKHKAAVKKFQLDRKMREGRSWRDLKKRKK